MKNGGEGQGLSDQNDDSLHYPLLALAGIVALVMAGVLVLATSRGVGGGARTASAGGPPAASRVVGEPTDRIDFEPGSDALPPRASERLVEIADAARRQSGKVVLISAFHAAGGAAVTNADRATKRALAVRHALEANGVAPERLLLDPPVVRTGRGDDGGAARRVEVRLR